MRALIFIVILGCIAPVYGQNSVSVERSQVLVLPEVKQVRYIFILRNFGVDGCTSYEMKNRWEETITCITCGLQTVKGHWFLQEEIPLSGTAADNNSRYDLPRVYNSILRLPFYSLQNKVVYIKPQQNIRL